VGHDDDLAVRGTLLAPARVGFRERAAVTFHAGPPDTIGQYPYVFGAWAVRLPWTGVLQNPGGAGRC
jgi:hypothetical protein